MTYYFGFFILILYYVSKTAWALCSNSANEISFYAFLILSNIWIAAMIIVRILDK